MRILIVSHMYAPDRSPRAYRWTAVAEEWARQGHQVHVVAAWKAGNQDQETLNGVRVERVGGRLGQKLRALLRRQGSPAAATTQPTPATGGGTLFRLAKRVYDLTWRRLFWPDYACLWVLPAWRATRRALDDGDWDALVTVSHPFTCHLVGLAAKKRRPGLTWVADMGDPFSFFTEIPLNNHALYAGLNRRAEAAVLERADQVAVTVDSCRTAYAQAFPGLGRISVVPPLLSLPPRPSTAERLGSGVHLVYVGTLYRAIRNPAWLLELTAALVGRGLDLHLHLFGDVNDCGAEIAAGQARLGDRLHLHGTVARDRVAAALAGADVLVNIGNSTPHQLPSKIVEYVAAAKPVLNLSPADDDTSAVFLAQAGLSLTLSTAMPASTAQIERAAAFLAAPPHPDPDRVAALLAPHRLDAVAAAYLDLAARPAPPRRRRVLVNAIHAKSGGGVTHLRNLLPHLAAQPDLELHVLLSHGQMDSLAEGMPDSIVFHPRPLPAGMLALLAWEQLWVPLLARRLDADVVFSPANYGPLLLRRQVVTLTNALDMGDTEHRLGKRLYWRALAAATFLSVLRARAVVAVSDFAAKRMTPPWLAGKVTVAAHGVSAFFTADPTTARQDFLLAVADIYIQKNLHGLIEAFAAIAADHPGLELRIAGRVVDPDYHARLTAQVAQAGLEQRVRFLGHCDRDTLRGLYRGCRLFVFASTMESFGMPILEAMACAAPVVCSNRAAMPEVAGDAALYFDPASPAELAQALRTLLDDGNRRHALGQAGLDRAAAFTWDRAATVTAEALRRAC